MDQALPQRAYFTWPAASSLAPFAAAAVVIFWVVLMGAVSPAQFGDSIEQYNWAHSLEWGYWKHPPLPTWIMRGAIGIMGASHWTAPVLAGACLVTSAFLVWRIAQMLMPGSAAALAVLLWPLHHALSWRAQVYNHNTVLVLFSTAMVWAALRASRSDRWRDWALMGLFAGFALLSKYQAAITIAGVVIALRMAGGLRSRPAFARLALAAGVATLTFAPHAIWAVQHDLPTLRYVVKSAEPLDAFDRLPELVKFSAMQLIMLMSMLGVGLFAFLSTRRGAGESRHDGSAAAHTRAWILGLVAFPMVVIALVVIVWGLTPQKMWGLQSLQFVPLWLAWRIDRARSGARTVAYALAAVFPVTVLSGAYVVVESLAPTWRAQMHTVDRIMPAEQLAQAAQKDWYLATACPLRLVTGSRFAAGLVSVYSGHYPQVLEDGDFRKSPWVAPDDLREMGALDMHGPMPLQEIPPGVAFIKVPAREQDGGIAGVYWRVIQPAHGCASS